MLSRYPDHYRPRYPRLLDSYRPANLETTFDVVLYRPTDRRDPHHWAIHVTSPTHRSTIHQVHDDIGGRGYYVAGVPYGV
jgi:hypothetical protein